LQKSGLAGAPVPEMVEAPVLLDASRVTFMDSSGLGRLALLIRMCRAADQLLVAVMPSAAFKTAVGKVQMDFLFHLADSELAAMRVIRERQASGGACKLADGGVVWVAFKRTLDALYYADMMTILESVITGTAGIRVLVVDLKEVEFIDSRAVGGLIRAWKLMSGNGGALFYADARPAVREIIALLRLDKVLAEWKGDPAG
jgi:anti-anti-sigma factor